MKRHRLFHTLVATGVVGSEGCAMSHDHTPTPPIEDVPSPDAFTMMDAGPDFGPPIDGSTLLDTRQSDAGPTEVDSGPREVDAGPNQRAFCEPGWPPTKGLRVCQVYDEDGEAMLRCAYTFGDDMMPDWDEAQACKLGIGEHWDGTSEHAVACTFDESPPCVLLEDEGASVLRCENETGPTECELGDEFFAPEGLLVQ